MTETYHMDTPAIGVKYGVLLWMGTNGDDFYQFVQRTNWQLGGFSIDEDGTLHFNALVPRDQYSAKPHHWVEFTLYPGDRLYPQGNIERGEQNEKMREWVKAYWVKPKTWRGRVKTWWQKVAS